jgi:hypothetical protein
MLLLTTLVPMSVLAGDETNPEITDVTGDARKNVDIQKAWFFEDSTTPGYLYITIQVVYLRTRFLGTLLNNVYWTQNNANYFVSASLGIYRNGMTNKVSISAGVFRTNLVWENITGVLDQNKGTITCKIPKQVIGNPQAGDVLTKTHAVTFQRSIFMDKIGWDAYLRDLLFVGLGLQKLLLSDHAPDTGYGNDYTMQY